MSNSNLYKNQFINTKDQPFQSNEDRFKNFMQQKNQEVLNKSRLPNPNLKTELVIPPKKDSNKIIKKEQKIRSTVLSINSDNRQSSNINVTTSSKVLNSNPLQISNGSNQQILTKISL